MNNNPIAVYTMFNCGGIAIYEIIYGIEDKVCYTWICGDKESKKCYAIIREDENGRLYFNKKHKIYLDECIKV